MQQTQAWNFCTHSWYGKHVNKPVIFAGVMRRKYKIYITTIYTHKKLFLQNKSCISCMVFVHPNVRNYIRAHALRTSVWCFVLLSLSPFVESYGYAFSMTASPALGKLCGCPVYYCYLSGMIVPVRGGGGGGGGVILREIGIIDRKLTTIKNKRARTRISPWFFKLMTIFSQNMSVETWCV